MAEVDNHADCYSATVDDTWYTVTYLFYLGSEGGKNHLGDLAVEGARSVAIVVEAGQGTGIVHFIGDFCVKGRATKHNGLMLVSATSADRRGTHSAI